MRHHAQERRLTFLSQCDCFQEFTPLQRCGRSWTQQPLWEGLVGTGTKNESSTLDRRFTVGNCDCCRSIDRGGPDVLWVEQKGWGTKTPLAAVIAENVRKQS